MGRVDPQTSCNHIFFCPRSVYPSKSRALHKQDIHRDHLVKGDNKQAAVSYMSCMQEVVSSI